MSDVDLLRQLAAALAGEFDNTAQAQAEPVWYVPLQLWHRPLPQRLQGHLAIFAEQANQLQLDRPYRQRILVLHTLPTGIIQGQYWAFQSPGLWRGAGADPDRLAQISPADLAALPGCELAIAATAGTFEATPPPGARCFFQYEGQTRQVELGFTVTATEFWSRDRGVDPTTGQVLWGALMGPYHFQKRQDFSAQLPA